MKRLYRSEENKVLAGICGGLGEYFDVDPVLVRVVVIVAIVLTGVLPGVLLYILFIFIIPKKSERRAYVEVIRNDAEDAAKKTDDE